MVFVVVEVNTDFETKTTCVVISHEPPACESKDSLGVAGSPLCPAPTL